MTQDEIIEIYKEVSNKLCDGKQWCWAGVGEPLQMFAKLVAEAERKKLQGQIETLGAMYELASKQRDVLMDEQRAQVAAWRVEHAINKAKNA
jgi:hypothetical protein